MEASFLQRMKAFLIDYLFILCYIAFLLVVSLFLFPPIRQLFLGPQWLAQLGGFLLLTLPVALYFIISDSTIGGQSFGKSKMGIKVVGINGKSVSVIHMIGRTILKLLPWELSHYLVYRLMNIEDVPLHDYVIGSLIYMLVFGNILAATFTKKKQSLYDIILQTRVIKL